MRTGLVWILLFLPLWAEARVFDYKDSDIAGYIRGTGGLSQLNQDAFANSSGNAVVSGASKYNYGAEIGFAFSLSPGLHLRIGAEVIQQSPVVAEGTNAAGTPLFDLNSSVFIFNPNLALEYVYSNRGNLRFYGEAGVGYANVTVVNDYKMTAAGNTAYGTTSDYKETMDTNVIATMAGVGLETLFTDNVTFSVDTGYRYLPVTSLKYKAPVNSIVAPGGVSTGGPVLNADGSNRKLNLSGFFGAIAFRFYLNFL